MLITIPCKVHIMKEKVLRYPPKDTKHTKKKKFQNSSFFSCKNGVELYRSKGGGCGITTVSGIPDENPMVIFEPNVSNSSRPPILNESHFHIR